MTKEEIKNFNESAVEIKDKDGYINRGWFVIVDGEYKLYPFDTIWIIHKYTLGGIKFIRHLTNDYEIGERK